MTVLASPSSSWATDNSPSVIPVSALVAAPAGFCSKRVRARPAPRHSHLPQPRCHSPDLSDVRKQRGTERARTHIHKPVQRAKYRTKMHIFMPDVPLSLPTPPGRKLIVLFLYFVVGCPPVVKKTACDARTNRSQGLNEASRKTLGALNDQLAPRYSHLTQDMEKPQCPVEVYLGRISRLTKFTRPGTMFDGDMGYPILLCISSSRFSLERFSPLNALLISALFG